MAKSSRNEQVAHQHVEQTLVDIRAGVGVAVMRLELADPAYDLKKAFYDALARAIDEFNETRLDMAEAVSVTDGKIIQFSQLQDVETLRWLYYDEMAYAISLVHWFEEQFDPHGAKDFYPTELAIIRSSAEAYGCDFDCHQRPLFLG